MVHKPKPQGPRNGSHNDLGTMAGVVEVEVQPLVPQGPMAGPATASARTSSSMQSAVTECLATAYNQQGGGVPEAQQAAI